MRTSVSVAVGAALLLSVAACDSGNSSGNSAPSVATTSDGGSTAATPSTTPTQGASSTRSGLSTSSSTSPAKPTSSKSASSKGSAKPALSEGVAKSSLATVSNNVPNCVTAVNGVYEGATSEEKTMTFWRTDASGKWVKDGQAESIEAIGPTAVAAAKVECKLLPGTSHAIFILHRDIGPTGASPTAQAFTKGSAGWGAIGGNGEDDLSWPGSTDDIIGTWSDAKFVGNLLKIGTFQSRTSQADSWVNWQAWRPSGDSFTRVGERERPANASDYGSGGWAVFTSPSGKNTCEMGNGEVSCMLSEKVQGPNGMRGISLFSNGTAITSGELGVGDLINEAGQWAHSGDSVPPIKDGAYVLPYGKSISDGTNKCTSTTNGFTCSNDVASFTVNTESLQRTGKRAD